MNNEKGSIALVLIIVLVITLAIATLTQLLMSERITARDSAESRLESFYDEAEVLELVENMTLQLLNEKKWDGEIAGQQLLAEIDLVEVENVLNNSVLPHINSDVTVSLTSLYSDELSTYCEEIYQNNSGINSSPVFVGYSCNGQMVGVEFVVTLNQQNRSKSLLVSFENIEPVVDSTGYEINLDTFELTTRRTSDF